MEIKFQTNDFLPRLSQVASIVNQRRILPILGNVVVKTLEDGAVLTCSDGETWVSIKAPIVEKDQEFSFCINAKDFVSTLKNLSGHVITLVLDKDTCMATGTHENGRFTLPYEKADEYPSPSFDIEGAFEKVMPSGNFLRSIEKAGLAVANNVVRQVLNGIRFEFFPEKMVAVSIDGQKLVKFSDFSIESDVEQKNGFILPKKPAHIVANLLGSEDNDIKLMFNKQCAVVSNSEFEVTTRLIEGTYPEYDRLIPKENSIEITLPTIGIVDALKRIMPVSDDSSYGIRLELTNGCVTLSAEDYKSGKSGEENIKCDYDGDRFVIGFKSTAMLEMCQNIDDDNVRLLMNDQKFPIQLLPFTDAEKTEHVSIIMPMSAQ